MGHARATATATGAWARTEVVVIGGTGITRYMFGGSNSAVGSSTRCWADYASAQYAAPMHAFSNPATGSGSAGSREPGFRACKVIVGIDAGWKRRGGRRDGDAEPGFEHAQLLE